MKYDCRISLVNRTFKRITKNLIEPPPDTLKGTSREITKTMTETSIKNNKALENLNDKLLEIMEDRGILASYLLSLLSKITNAENTSHSKLVKDPQLNKVNDLFINKRTPVTLYNNLLTFRDTDENFELQEDHLKMMTNKNFNVDLAKLSDEKQCMILKKKCILTRGHQLINVLRIDRL